MRARKTSMLCGLVAASLAGLVACGEAALTLTTPTPTPDQTINCQFSVGVQDVFQTRDCANAGCHGNPGVASLTLGGIPLNEMHHLLVNSGGTLQRSGGCDVDPDNCPRDVRPGEPERSLLVLKPLEGYAESHGGARAWSGPGDRNYDTLACWIEAGAPND